MVHLIYIRTRVYIKLVEAFKFNSRWCVVQLYESRFPLDLLVSFRMFQYMTH